MASSCKSRSVLEASDLSMVTIMTVPQIVAPASPPACWPYDELSKSRRDAGATTDNYSQFSPKAWRVVSTDFKTGSAVKPGENASNVDRKSTRLNSSHSQISYAVFCL